MNSVTTVGSDTICALATPQGVAGLAVVRVSGLRAFEVCDAFFRGSHTLDDTPGYTIRYGWWMSGLVRIDSVTASVFRAPHSYTGEDVVEIGCHGGPFTSHQIIENLLESGARLANPGEFTQRAFVNQKLDLTQAEAVADIIHAQSVVGAKTAARQLAGGFTTRITKLRQRLLDVIGLLELELDFSEEDVEFVDRSRLHELIKGIISEVDLLASSAHSAEILRSGFHVAVVGYPNAGKSSLFNALLQRSRAIVSDVAGTTRDYLVETLLIDGYAIHLADTAGIRLTEDSIELQGISLTRSVLEQADAVVLVNDASLGLDHSDSLRGELSDSFSSTPIVVLQNKSDLVGNALSPRTGHEIVCSTVLGVGMDLVRDRLRSLVQEQTIQPTDVLVNARQAVLLHQISSALSSAIQALEGGQSPDLLSVDIRASIRLLGDISGESWNPDVLDTVFSRFCIGK